ncbi:NucA/NucB deoxyribonuclease domain-containing protein [Streptomyces monashensis]|uniref:NucA/NucB deoxyribonuclease domain-containing protein n=1 Tax=Streptomyces monashensis TaxID=1678012 RepID=UPI0033C4413B
MIKRSVAAALTAFTLMGTAATTASAAPHHVTYKITTRIERTVHVDAAPNGRPTGAAQDGIFCAKPVIVTNELIRTRSCTINLMRLDVFKMVDGVPELVGNASFNVQQETNLNIRSLSWSEKISMTKATVEGEAAGITVDFSAVAPGVKAAVTGDLAKPFELGAAAPAGTINYTMPLTKGQQNTTHTNYNLLYTKAGYLPGDTAWGSETYRCDNGIANNGKGCVYPKHTPTDDGVLPSAMLFLPRISQNIRNVQRAPLHIGRPGSSIPLERADAATQKDNRRDVCSGKPGPGDINWIVIPPVPPQKFNATTPTCDEYPFASTYQGGVRYAPPNRAIKWVPKWENDLQGNILLDFYRQNRILIGDPYYINMGV